MLGKRYIKEGRHRRSDDANHDLADDTAVPLRMVGRLDILERERLGDERPQLGLSKGVAHVLELPAAANEDALKPSRLIKSLSTDVGVLLVLAI